MELNNYQEAIKKYRLDSYDDAACFMGLLAEAGEVAAVVQKGIRDRWDFPTVQEKMKKELGDVLWHVAAVASDQGFSLEDIAQTNLDKLQDRLERQKLEGSGDDR